MEAKKKESNFFLNETGSELSSSNSEDDDVHTQYLLQHAKRAKAQKELQEKAARLAAQAEAAQLSVSQADLIEKSLLQLGD